jgi:hypothetical protein
MILQASWKEHTIATVAVLNGKYAYAVMLQLRIDQTTGKQSGKQWQDNTHLVGQCSNWFSKYKRTASKYS